jgi:hypothetical protein
MTATDEEHDVKYWIKHSGASKEQLQRTVEK